MHTRVLYGVADVQNNETLHTEHTPEYEHHSKISSASINEIKISNNAKSISESIHKRTEKHAQAGIDDSNDDNQKSQVERFQKKTIVIEKGGEGGEHDKERISLYVGHRV